MQDAIELQAGEAVIGGDAVLVLLGDVEAQEDLAVVGQERVGNPRQPLLEAEPR